MPAALHLTQIPADEHNSHAVEHQRRVEQYTQGFLARRHAGKRHPVEDFLFTYYSHSPGQLARWHPGVGRVLDGAGSSEQAKWKFYTTVEDGTDDGGVTLDVGRFRQERDSMIGFARRLLSATVARPAQLGCFGLHEWAMVHGLRPGQQRHEALPLRLSQAETDAVVERERLVCSHIDAFRFFTPSAAPRNATQPTRATQEANDNPACLHVGMDLYKWAMKLSPLVPSSLVLDCFEHARETRVLDMEASPYDVRPLGYGVVPIETPAGKAEYVRRQRALADRAEQLRGRILGELEGLPVDAP